MASKLWADIEAGNKVFMDVFSTGDASKLSELYTEDCKVMPTGADAMVGRKAVVDVFGGAMSNGVKSVKLTIDEVGPMGDGDTAYERSRYNFYDASGKEVDNGKYLVIWKKIDSKWYLYIDIFNTSKSAP